VITKIIIKTIITDENNCNTENDPPQTKFDYFIILPFNLTPSYN